MGALEDREEKLRRQWAEAGQGHLFRFWQERPQRQRERLLDDLAALQWRTLDALKAALGRAVPPRPSLEPLAPVALESWRGNREARAAGEELIAAGKTACLTVAGGQGSRLGYEGPKGFFPLSPIRRAPLFQIFAEKILAARRRFCFSQPWYIMTSPLNHRQTKAFFRKHSFFGLPEGEVIFFRQGLLPTLAPDGRLLLAEEGGLLKNPDGHGGSFDALRQQGLLRHMAGQGIEELFYFQVDNPLVRVPDPEFLGLHRLRASEMSSKVIPKAHPEEKLGVIGLIDGKPGIIEYSDLDDDSRQAHDSSGRLKYSYGSIAIHLLNVSFLSRAELPLPLHLARKKVKTLVPYPGGGRIEEPEAVKFEKFIFDAIPLARNPLFFATSREQEFAPLKNASGPDSIETCVEAMVRQYARWLEQCGVAVPWVGAKPAYRIEISPLFAVDAETLKIRLGASVNEIDADTLLL